MIEYDEETAKAFENFLQTDPDVQMAFKDFAKTKSRNDFEAASEKLTAHSINCAICRSLDDCAIKFELAKKKNIAWNKMNEAHGFKLGHPVRID